MRWWKIIGGLLAATLAVPAGTLAIIETGFGTMYLELYDADKPATVRNFIQYVQSGRYTNSIVQRWDPAFVIQAGGYYVDPSINYFRPIQRFGRITNEYGIGRTFTNARGTIAMARVSKDVHSASSEWFINLTNNAFLDKVDEGFTVFGSVIKGTNVLDVFHPDLNPQTRLNPHNLGIYAVCADFCTRPVTNSLGEQVYMNELPARGSSPTLSDLIYLNISFVQANIRVLPTGAREITWNSVAGVTNRIEGNSGIPRVWRGRTNVLGTGELMSYIDESPQQSTENYRVRVLFE